MKVKMLLLFLLAAVAADSQTLIKNANIVDVEERKILKGYDVVAIDGKIISVDKGRKYKLPAGVQVIDGSGKFLIPGLMDAHVHFFQSGGLYARPDAIDLRKFRSYAEEIRWTHQHMEDLLRRYLSIGVTSVADVGSTYRFLMQRDSFAGKPYAPHIYMSGPLLTTYIPEEFKGLGDDAPFVEMMDEENARKIVREQSRYHPDLIKIWYIVLDENTERGARGSIALVKAAIDEAHRHGLRAAVHATERITAQLAAEAGADFLVHGIEDEEVTQDFIHLLKSKKIILCPTLVVGDNYTKAFTKTYAFSADELTIAHPAPVQTILDFPLPDSVSGKLAMSYYAQSANLLQEKKRDATAVVNLKKMLDAGVDIATGTDAGNIGTQHAGSYFEELQAMRKAGASLWQLLQCSTINGAKAVGVAGITGSIVKGKRADMILLNANPLENLLNWRKIDWLIYQGTAVRPDSLVKDKTE